MVYERRDILSIAVIAPRHGFTAFLSWLRTRSFETDCKRTGDTAVDFGGIVNGKVCDRCSKRIMVQSMLHYEVGGCAQSDLW